jgi:TetR/AcrR family transcriptional repressor of bet genes
VSKNREESSQAVDAKNPAKSQAKGQRKRRHLIEAAIRVVGRKGVARATIQDVATESGLSVGLANFYFAGKEDLFRAAFQTLAEEYEAVWRQRNAGLTDPAVIVDTMIVSAFDSRVLDQAKAAAWFAFWGEACHGDPSFLAINEIEQSYTDEILKQFLLLARQHGRSPAEARDLGRGLEAMIEGLWSAFAAPGSKQRVPQAVRVCRQYVMTGFGIEASDGTVAKAKVASGKPVIR